MKLEIWDKSKESYEILENANISGESSIDLGILAFFPAEVKIFQKTEYISCVTECFALLSLLPGYKKISLRAHFVKNVHRSC